MTVTAPRTDTRRTAPTRHGAPPSAPLVDIVLPVYNEQEVLARSAIVLVAYLRRQFPFRWRVTIADNASTDGTWSIARLLESSIPEVRAVRLEQKGRGRALRAVWSVDDADVLAYMDVDLSTDLKALLPLVAPLVSGHSDLAIGTRLDRRASVVRSPRRELISRCYNLLTRLVLGARFSDAQCGFKAVRADAARRLLPLVEDDAWFFDTELLVLAERMGLRISEVPVDWVEDTDSRVAIVATALADLKGIARLARTAGRRDLPAGTPRRRYLPSPVAPATSEAGEPRPRLARRLLSFCLIGAASTAAYAVLYLALRAALPAQIASGLALLLTAIANTAANRRLTFGVRGTSGRLRHQGQGLIVFALGLAVTSGSLALLGRVAPSASHTVELAVLLAASVVATLLRFVLFQAWIFPARSREAGGADDGHSAADADADRRVEARREPRVAS